MKDSAYQAHKAVCEREKAMLAPLKSAEKTIKKAMGDYLMEQERKRREAEEAARRAAEAEMQRKLDEAEKLEASGDIQGAEAAMEDAVVMDEASNYIASTSAKPKASGVSTSKDWEIVPVSFADIEIRPVDQAAVMRLIRHLKEKLKFPASLTGKSQK